MHEAAADQKPFASSQWTLSSVLATVQKVLGLKGGPLTKRDAWAATFDNLLATRTTPRDDCPLTLPALPPPQPGQLARQLALPLDEHMQWVVKSLCELTEGADGRDQNADQPLLAGLGGVGPYCETLGICRDAGSACGANLTTVADFAAWRVPMWNKWLAGQLRLLARKH